MAICKMCESSGWLVTLDEYGLCSQCQRFHSRTIADNSRIVKDSLEAIDASGNAKTRLSHISTAIKHCVNLEPYARKGIDTVEPAPREIARELSRKRNEIVKDHIRDNVISARKIAKNADTLDDKLEGYHSAIKAVSSLIFELDDAALVKKAITAISAERDALHAKLAQGEGESGD